MIGEIEEDRRQGDCCCWLLEGGLKRTRCCRWARGLGDWMHVVDSAKASLRSASATKKGSEAALCFSPPQYLPSSLLSLSARSLLPSLPFLPSSLILHFPPYFPVNKFSLCKNPRYNSHTSRFFMLVKISPSMMSSSLKETYEVFLS